MTPSETPPQGSPVAPADPFFILQECRDLLVRRISDIARQCGITDARVLDALNREIGEAHDELASAEQQEGFEQTHGLTASRISLVGNDDLELDIRIGDITSHLKDDEHIDHWRVQLRYMTLLQRPGMTADDNPVGLETIRRGLWVLCRESGGTLDQQFGRLERIEEMLALKLPEIYMEVNEILERRGVEPAPAQLIRQTGSARAPSGSGAGNTTGGGSTPGAGNPLAALQQTMQQQQSSDIPFSGGFAGAPGGNFAIDASTMVMLGHLFERLGAIERQQASTMLQPHTLDDNPLQPPRPLRSQDLDLPAGKPTAIILDTLSLIFDAIFASPDLPDVIKTLLGRLQIPLLKRAILDPAFFADTQHPARQLVNRMARAAIGLPQNIARDDPLCREIATLADAARAALESKDGDLTTHLAELDAMIARRDAAIQAAIQPYIRQVLGHESRENALASAQAWLQKTLVRTSEPAFIDFLSVHWVRLMQKACLEAGIGGQLWKEGEATIEHLLWSVQPKQTQEERQKLMTVIPALIKRIGAGLDTIAVSQEARKPFMDACFDLQTNALRGRASGSAPPRLQEPSAAPKTPALPQRVRILEEQGIVVQYLGQPVQPASPWRSGKQSTRAGDWLKFNMPDGTNLCGLYCWQAPNSQTILLHNREWGYAVALAPQLLEQQLQTGGARIVSNVLLFDEAAEKALKRLNST